jgi:RecA-family ATPase
MTGRWAVAKLPPPTHNSPDLAAKWYEESLGKIPSCGKGWNPHLMSVARAAKRASVDLHRLVQDVVAHTPGGVPDGRLNEIERAYERCVINAAPRMQHTAPKVKRTPPSVELPDGLPLPAIKQLETLFKPDEVVVIAPGHYNKEKDKDEPCDWLREAKTCAEWIKTFKATPPSLYFKNSVGVYLKGNPMKPGHKTLKRKDGTTYTLPLADDESVSAFRWLLVESDEIPKEQQLGALRELGIPYGTITDSGGKSLHELVRVDAESLEEYKAIAAKVYAMVGEVMAMDEKNSNPSRYTRLAGAMRRDNVQSLLEFHPEAEAFHTWYSKRVLCCGRSLAEYATMSVPPEDTLLGNRYLCRQGAMLFVGPSGVGKSSASVQQDIAWALGRDAFGIKPAHPMRVLCVQAENDLGDMIEMARGVVAGMKLTAAEVDQLSENTLYVSHKESTGLTFLGWLETLLDAYRPDIVRIDPLQAYLGGDPKDTELLSAFCRSTLNPLLVKYDCAAIVNHHTPKTNYRDTSEWKAVDWMYAGAGGADLTNWARCILVIDPVGKVSDEIGSCFRFIAAKRGKRIGWHDEDGRATFARWFRHARDGGIYWEETDQPEGTAGGNVATKEMLLNIVPLDSSIPKKVLLSKAQAAGIGLNKARGWIAEYLHEKILHEWERQRSRTRGEPIIARFPENEQYKQGALS